VRGLADVEIQFRQAAVLNLDALRLDVAARKEQAYEVWAGIE
jgi:hypothetical protein